MYVGDAMQKYNNMSDNQNLAKRILSEFLGFLKFKVDNDGLTLAEEQSIVKLIEERLPLSATCEDLARYYGKSPENIRGVIHRRLLSKPKRRVMYSFLDFSKIAPDHWVK